MDCMKKFNCRGMCCYDGVYLSEKDIKKIDECINKYPDEFPNKDYLEISDWKYYKGLQKTKAVKLKKHRDDYPKHFNQTRCFFQDEETGKCKLQEIALKYNEDKWKYKPLSCCIFPLRKRNNNIELLEKKEDDPNIYDDYDGYESALPCFNKIDTKELKEEFDCLTGDNMKIIEYEDKYLNDVRDLLTELEEYIVSIDKDNLDHIHPEYHEKMALIDLKEVRNNNGKCYLAIDDNKVVGLIMGTIPQYDEYDYLDYKCPKRGEITELIVTSKIRNKGVGQELINKMEEYFKSLGCEYILVDVFAYNDNAIKFYNKEGYHTRMYTNIKKL